VEGMINNGQWAEKKRPPREDVTSWLTSGTVVEGVLQDISLPEWSQYESQMVTLLAPDGAVIRFFCPTVLEQLLNDVVKGDTLRVLYMGVERTKSGRPLKMFRVWVKGGDDAAKPGISGDAEATDSSRS